MFDEKDLGTMNAVIPLHFRLSNLIPELRKKSPIQPKYTAL